VAKCFIDTNVFFYAADGADPVKQAKALSLMTELASSKGGVVSSQVVQEFACNALRKLKLPIDQVLSLCNVFGDYKLVKQDTALVQDALRLMSSASVSFWDACIVAAAQHADCSILYTEDLKSGERLGGLAVVNPFA
jgi:predicted nucleic acid-binding protein